MKTVWKFPLNLGETTVMIPEWASVLYAEMDPADRTCPAIWALVDPHAKEEARTFRVVGTGHVVPTGIYVGTMIATQGLVLHVFETSSAQTLYAGLGAL